MLPKNALQLFLILTIFAGTLFAGVRQSRNMTNVGTNAYSDMQVNADETYATVNPNYTNQATGYNGVVAGGYYYDYSGWAGSTAHGAMIPIGTVVENVPSSFIPVMVEGSRFYYENNIFLAEVFDGNAVVYQVVPAPMGAVVSTLPAGCVVQYFNNKSFSVCGNTYYQQVAGGYQVVAAN